ncbi:MAG: replication-relaxation family protein [Gaiellaceae bacterium MAG52_C11]|nr:replication-relaxation family protein [Candidatus Gaiellasilicea maunaloa]
MSAVRKPRHQGADPRTQADRRPFRASAERLFELVRHLTERDREVALCLYRHRILTTSQLQLLFFSSRRRAQDRLLFLYRNRIVDRFYPAAPFGSGKPEAHWLLDEAGALLVAATLGLERKQLGWQRRDDWGSHPQLAHQLETNRFLTELVAATLTTSDLGVRAWWSPAEAAGRLSLDGKLRVLPDTGFTLVTSAGVIECYLEWDRSTETQARLAEKLLVYRRAEARLHGEAGERALLIVLPGERRLGTLRRAHTELAGSERLARSTFPATGFRWPLLATTVPRLRAEGALAAVWERLDLDSGRQALPALPIRDGEPVVLAETLGRCWHKESPDFWRRLSPLGNHGQGAAGPPEPLVVPPPHERDGDLRLSGIDGSMDDPDESLEERWP